MSATNLQHCSNARMLLSQLGPTLQRASGTSNRSQAAQAVSVEYTKKALGLNQQSIDRASVDQKNSYLQEALFDCVMQLNAVNEIGQKVREQAGTDFLKMAEVERKIIIIQAKFRQVLAIKKIEKDIEA